MNSKIRLTVFVIVITSFILLATGMVPILYGSGYALARSLSGPDQPPPDPTVLFITSTTFKVIFALVWLLLAFTLYRRARAREFNALAWGLLGLLTGPFAWIFYGLRCLRKSNSE